MLARRCSGVRADLIDAHRSAAEVLAVARDRMIETMGYEALVDVAAVVANFTMMTRIVDGTGTPLDEGSVDMPADLRQELGLDDFVSARHVDR